MAGVSREAMLRKHRLIVLKKNVPIFELQPLSADDVALWSFERDLANARVSAQKEKTYSTAEVREILGLEAV